MTLMTLLFVFVYFTASQCKLSGKPTVAQASRDFGQRPVHHVRKILQPTKVSLKDTDLIIWHPNNRSLLDLQQSKWTSQTSARILLQETSLSDAFVAWSQRADKGSVAVFVRADVLVDPQTIQSLSQEAQLNRSLVYSSTATSYIAHHAKFVTGFDVTMPWAIARGHVHPIVTESLSLVTAQASCHSGEGDSLILPDVLESLGVPIQPWSRIGKTSSSWITLEDPSVDEDLLHECLESQYK